MVAAPVPASAGGLPELFLGREAGSPSFALGLSAVQLSSALVHGAGGRSGYEFTFGYRLHGPRSLPWSRVSLELNIAGVSGLNANALPQSGVPAGESGFALLTFGMRVDLFEVARSPWTPWVAVGAGVADLSWNDSGHGEGALVPVLSAGADLGLAGGLVLRVRLATAGSAAMGGLSYSAATLGLAWEFLRPAHHRRPGWGEPLPPPAPHDE